MRRAGKVLTGVDRVELAYLRAVLADPVPAFGLIRSKLGYILLDEAGMQALVTPLSGPDRGLDPSAHRTRTWRKARRLAVGRVVPTLLGRMLRLHVPQGAAYLNVGHSNLTARVLRTVQSALGARTAVMIHDIIPLEFPDYQRDGAVAPFAAMVDRVSRFADLILYNSHDTARLAEARMVQPPRAIVAHLGTELAAARSQDLPENLPPPRPYFVCVGTIEPRKNHAFLLDIWEEMGTDAPRLIIAGSRGWKNEDVFDRLDRLPPNGPVREVAGLSDGALAALIEGANGVLFPTHAEGFGLPATEAAARGVPLIVNDLNVFREILGEIPVYASVSDRYLWINKVKELAEAEPTPSRPKQFEPPTWDAHFKTVLRLT
ncbi:glycosyltransferase family 1 protein [uncultured Tateyamaria sp.]|uniref:glycosyltransferase family 4 protein n=1 Tax=uncultured Tateyamaria sp. TaxID=455651 RepID=UPI00261EB99C|nr:glycosyltransferase family 1 protein [uncultured Tateyamaria sp.]